MQHAQQHATCNMLSNMLHAQQHATYNMLSIMLRRIILSVYRLTLNPFGGGAPSNVDLP